MKAIILAAGYGQRFRPQTLQLAKPALPLFDLPLIAYSIHYLHLMGVKEIIINLHHLPDTIKRALQRLSLSSSVSWSFEPQLLSSGGGIKNVESFFHGEEDFLVINADSIISAINGTFLNDFIHQHKGNRAMATLLSCPQEGLGEKYGALWCNEERQIQFIGKNRPERHLYPQHYTGLMLLSSGIFKYLPQGPSRIFQDAIKPAIQRGELVQSFYTDEIEWFETGDLKSYLDTQKTLLTYMKDSHSHCQFLKSTHKSFLDYSIEVNDSLQWVSPHSTMNQKSTKVGMNVVICSGARLGANIEVQNSVVSWGGLQNESIHSEMIL